MRLVTASLAAVAALAAALPALAAPARITDVQFIEANRCLGLMSSKALASPEAASLSRFIKDQSYGRDGYVYDRADQVRDQAESAANHASPDYRTRLTAERDGVCQNFLGGTSTATGGGGPSGTNSSIR
jgi:hypothetical protein